MANDSPLKRVFRPFEDSTGGSNDELGNPWIAGAAVVLLLLVPLLPFFLVAWSISRTLRGVRERVSWE
ncbi:hypothetical protein HWV07_12150 [Natronomonas salina]|uniref:DUF7535 family protein n=1 Tax=Natronomonas salina TaxID=1710540 RepID=UPI0015B50CA8|nr:hypothetical protein [Natronomonas salina]QLD89738.1 hypothetical protein HWV07_12150 [Natronomonas salina]